jgi:hypothetical protein
VDITFADPADVPQVTEQNCFNSSIGRSDGGPIGQNFVYTASGLTAGSPAAMSLSWTTFMVLFAASIFAMLM